MINVLLKTESFEHCLYQPYKLTIELLNTLQIPLSLDQIEFQNFMTKLGFPSHLNQNLFLSFQYLTNQVNSLKIDTECLIFFLFIQLRGNIKNSSLFTEKSPNAHLSPKIKNQNNKYDQEQQQILKYKNIKQRHIEDNVNFLQENIKTENQFNFFFQLQKGKFCHFPQFNKISLQDFGQNQKQKSYILGLSKAVFVKKDVDFQDLKILSCEDSQIFIESPLKSLLIQNVSNCKIFVSSIKQFCTVDRCENLQITLISGMLKIQNTINSQFNYYGSCAPCITGDSRNLIMGPHNANYVNLIKLMQNCNIMLKPQYYNKYKDTVCEKDINIIFISPKEFDMFVLPNEYKQLNYQLFCNTSIEELEQNCQILSQIQENFEKQNSDKFQINIPLLASQEFRNEILNRHQQKLNFAQKIKKANLNQDQMKSLNQALQIQFKEWAIQSNSMKNLTELVKLIE